MKKRTICVVTCTQGSQARFRAGYISVTLQILSLSQALI